MSNLNLRKVLAAGVAGVIAAFMAIMVFGGPQLQQSGGAGGTTNVNQFGGTSVSLGQKAMSASMPVTVASDQSAIPVSGTFWQATQPVSGTVSAAESGTWTVQPGNTANTTAWLVKSIPNTSCTGTSLVDSGIVVIPAASTVVTSFGATSCVTKIFVSNTTATAATVTVTDNAGTPNNYIVAFSVPGNSNMILDMGGIKMTSGVKWSQGTASALNGQVVGYQ